LIGECEVQLADLLEATSPPVVELINQKKKMKKKDYKNSGKLTVVQCKVSDETACCLNLILHQTLSDLSQAPGTLFYKNQ